MSIDLVADTWNEIKRFIIVTDRYEAADSLVNLLIDNNFDADDISDAFQGDADIKKALGQFGKDSDEEYEEDYDGDEDYEDD